MFGIIAKFRSKRAYKKFGFNLSLNPYTPKINRIPDNWTYWYEAHREEYYKDNIPDYNKNEFYSTIYDEWS